MNPRVPVRLLLADDHILVRHGLTALLQQQQNLRVVAQAGNGEEAVALFRQHQPDVVLMDVRMPRLDGLQALIRLRQEFPHARVILLSAYETQEEVYQAVQRGARAYLRKDIEVGILCQAIEQVSKGGSYLPPSAVAKITDRLQAPALTTRETEILELLAQGKSNQEISEACCISVGTVKAHCNTLFRKMEAKDRTHAVVVGLQRGLIQLA